MPIQRTCRSPLRRPFWWLPLALLLLPAELGATEAQAGDEVGRDRLERPGDHQLVWSDEFDADGLPDPSRWAYDTARNRQGWFNNERQYYAEARLANSRVLDGSLVLTARAERLRAAPDWGGQAYSSARLHTEGLASWTYGYFEVRARLPCARGSWPAIWMLGSQGEWPDRGELDIVEHVGHRPGRVLSTVHTRSGFAGEGKGGGTEVPTACTAFHVYQMLWTPDLVRFGVDGIEHARYTKSGDGARQWPFDAPQFLILNIAVGGDLGGRVVVRDFPAAMVVDYVRVYQRPALR